MCCFVLLFSALGPRFVILGMWLFGSRVDLAFSTWVWPLLGLLLAPWTTMMYLLTWSVANGVSGADWILVGIGVAIDVGTYAAKPAQSRYTRI
jgi:hypothetical protein